MYKNYCIALPSLSYITLKVIKDRYLRQNLHTQPATNHTAEHTLIALKTLDLRPGDNSVLMLHITSESQALKSGKIYLNIKYKYN